MLATIDADTQVTPPSQ